MCISPSFVWVQRGPNWEQQPVACRQCWRCRQNRVNDYVARSLAEAAVSQVTATVNLTYAPRDDLADKVLAPRHFQLFMKLLRKAGHKVRYLVAGEYGETKGRAHFHALLFFQHIQPLADRGPVPAYRAEGPFCREIPHKRMVHIREWPHGHVTVDWSASEKAARYVCKYLLAENKNNVWFSLSKKPALGAQWFAEKAARAVELDVLPSSFEYLPPGGNRKLPYLMTGATRRDYLNAITQDADRIGQMSEWVAKSFEKYRRDDFKRSIEQFGRDFPEEVAQQMADNIAAHAVPEETMRRRILAEDAQMAYDQATAPERFRAMMAAHGVHDEKTWQNFLSSAEYFLLLALGLGPGDVHCSTRSWRFGGRAAAYSVPAAWCHCIYCRAVEEGRIRPAALRADARWAPVRSAAAREA